VATSSRKLSWAVLVVWLPQPLAWTSFAVGVGVGALGNAQRGAFRGD